MALTICAGNLDVLHDPAFEIPKERSAGDFGSYLGVQFRNFFEQTERLKGRLGEELAKRTYWMRELSSTIEAVVDVTRQGRHERAWELMEEILDEHLGKLELMSARHARVIGPRSWYRLTTWTEATTREDVFHLPFQLKAPSYRFSPPGRPAIYLGNNIYVCWLECGGTAFESCEDPRLESCRAARFEIEPRDDEYFLDLPANHSTYLEPLKVVASLNGVVELDATQFGNSPYYTDVEAELAEYLSLWPLLMSITVQKLKPTPPDPPEYLIPQLLMRWVLKQKNLLGVRYFTSKFDRANNSNDLSINVVLPTRTTEKPEGFCDFLADRVKCTPPLSFEELKKLADETLVTKETGGVRQAAHGRCMVEWNRGSWNYEYTPFGRMEYLLDRPEFPVARIDAG